MITESIHLFAHHSHWYAWAIEKSRYQISLTLAPLFTGTRLMDLMWVNPLSDPFQALWKLLIFRWQRCYDNNKSGWMTGDDFLLFTEYFIKHIIVTNHKPILFLLNSRHVFIFDRAWPCQGKWRGVTVFLTTYYSQTHPLDRSTASGAWLTIHPENLCQYMTSY
jgi:hypothetical protein